MRYVKDIDDERGDLIEVQVYCSAQCFREGTGEDPYGHAYPCPEEADYRQYCPNCQVMTVAAIEDDSFDSWPIEPDNQCRARAQEKTPPKLNDFQDVRTEDGHVPSFVFSAKTTENRFVFERGRSARFSQPDNI